MRSSRRGNRSGINKMQYHFVRSIVALAVSFHSQEPPVRAEGDTARIVVPILRNSSDVELILQIPEG